MLSSFSFFLKNGNISLSNATVSTRPEIDFSTDDHIQGPPYILARYKTAVFSKSTDNFQKLFYTNEGCGSSECLCQKIFQSASVISYFCCKSYRFEKAIYRKQYDINNGKLTPICQKKTAKK